MRDHPGAGRFSEDYPLERRSKPLEKWPALDRLAWERARLPASAFERPGPGALWAKETCRARLQAYGRYLNFLDRKALLKATEGPGERLTQERVALYLAEAKQVLAPHTVRQTLMELKQVARAMVPEQSWDWITRHPGRPSHTEVRDGRKPQMVFDPKVLLCKALDALDGMPGGTLTFAASIEYRDMLIAAFQCAFSLRRRNLVELTLGNNLIIDGNVIHLIIRPEEMKNYVPIRWIIPDYLKPYLLAYINRHRVLLLDGRMSEAVWINNRHQPLKYGAAARLFHDIGMKLLGYPIYCHSFRHSVVTAILKNDPRKVRVASGTLAHRSLRAANEHYDKSGGVGSLRIWDKVRGHIIRGKGEDTP